MNGALAPGDQEILRTVVDRVRHHRLSRNWTQAEMARRVGISRQGYQNFENGYGNITLTNLARVLGALGFTANLGELIPPVVQQPTMETLLQPTRQRARARKLKTNP